MDSDSYKVICSKLTLQNKKEGFFRDLVEQLSMFVRLEQFSSCSTDIQRIRFCAERLWAKIGAELIFQGKNLEDAITRRLEGNDAFKTKDYKKALLLYCQSIIRCPVGTELALTYANRSALFQEMKEWELSVNDVEMAFLYSYPEENRHKLYERMALCHVKLFNAPKARVSLNLAKHFMSKYKHDNDPKLHKKLDKLSSELESIPANNGTKLHEEEKNAILNPNPKFPNASSKFDVYSNDSDGRFAVARDNIPPGETVLIEKPYSAVLLPERLGTHCTHCFKKLKGAIACETCANVAFCSKSCRSLAEVYHKYECRIAVLLQGSGMSALPYLALRMITQNTAAQLLEIFPELMSKPKEIILDNNSTQYDSNSYKNIYNLAALENQREPNDFLERTIMALFLMKCLRITGYFDINLFKNPEPTLEELKIGSLILRNLQILQFNSYEIGEFLIDKTESFKKSSSYLVGIGIYATASFVNHSCAPNATRYFDGLNICITSIQPIQIGEPISDTYGPIFTNTEKHDRQYKLAGRYWFCCHCVACRDNHGKYALLQKIPEYSDAFDESTKEKLNQLKEKYFDPALQYMESLNNKEDAIDNLIKYLEKSHVILFNTKIDKSELKTFSLAQVALKLCLCAKGTVYYVESK